MKPKYYTVDEMLEMVDCYRRIAPQLLQPPNCYSSRIAPRFVPALRPLGRPSDGPLAWCVRARFRVRALFFGSPCCSGGRSHPTFPFRRDAERSGWDEHCRIITRERPFWPENGPREARFDPGRRPLSAHDRFFPFRPDVERSAQAPIAASSHRLPRPAIALPSHRAPVVPRCARDRNRERG